MSVLSNHINELKTSEAFTEQSKVFDNLYGHDAIIQYKRSRVRQHVLKYAGHPGSMLELNCGTGEDAIFFAQNGFFVHATDISSGMLDRLTEKIEGLPFQSRITVERCSFTQLGALHQKGPFDHIFSNFGGLNCTGELEKVLNSFKDLVRPGGVVTLVIISKFCLWETLMVFKGKMKTAFRRFFASGGRKAHIEGKFFTCWYYAPSFIKKHLQVEFEFIGLEGLCSLVPPSYMEKFAERNPASYRFLVNQENKLKDRWPWNRMGDYYIISFRKK